MWQLPQFRGYTVDVRLRQFHVVTVSPQGEPLGMRCIDFASEAGIDLLTALVSELLPVQELDGTEGE